MENIRDKTLEGFLYKFLERVGASGIQLVITIVLARILMPNEYGIIALVSIIITILDVFVTYGFGNSLVVNKNSDKIDFSTCFYFGLFLSAVLYAACFFLAPLLANWFSIDSSTGDLKYDVSLLTLVIRIMCLRLPIAAINSVQHAYVQKNMLFRKFFYSTLIGTVISGVAAIIMAFNGFGVWALVEQYLGNILIDTICLFILVEWKPTCDFSFSRLKKIYSYGWKILVVGLIDVGYNQLRNIVIAKKYTTADLAYYSKGNEFPSTCNNFIEPTISSVTLPTLSKVNDDQDRMKSITRRCIKTSTFIIFPMMIGLACVAHPLIEVLLTDKWIDSVIFLQIFCLAYLFRPIQFINNSVIRASGKSGLLLILDIIKKIIGVILLIVGIQFGITGIALSLAITNLISTFINIWPNKKILNYGYLDQFKDIFWNLLIAIVMGASVFALSFIKIPSVVLLIVQVLTGILLYFSFAAITKNDSFFYGVSLIKDFLHNHKRNGEEKK